MDDSDSNDSETTNLRKENEELKRELKASTLHLAALAHKEYQVPDGSIREDYEKLCRAIETWIDYASSNETGDFRNRFKEALKIEEKTHRLRDIGIEYQSPAALDPRLDWLRIDMLHYFILSLVIGKYVFEILRRQYPIGVTETQEAMLLSIEEEMSKMGKCMKLPIVPGVTVSMLIKTSGSKIEDPSVEIRDVDCAMRLRIIQSQGSGSTLSYTKCSRERFIVLV